MNKDLLAALRKTPGCKAEVPGLYGYDQEGNQYRRLHNHRPAIRYAAECDACLTRLAEAVLNHYGPTIMGLARTGQVISSVIGAHVDWTHDWPSLLTALRSETPR